MWNDKSKPTNSAVEIPLSRSISTASRRNAALSSSVARSAQSPANSVSNTIRASHNSSISLRDCSSPLKSTPSNIRPVFPATNVPSPARASNTPRNASDRIPSRNVDRPTPN